MNIDYEPYSDTTISDKEIVALHENYIAENNYKKAKEIVDNDASMNKKGFRASFFNAIETKIKELQIYLLNKKASPDEYYSATEPTMDFMKENGYLFWIKPMD